MDIAAWLRGLGLERYEQAFRENEIDLRVLPELTADDLKELGVAAIGHRRLLLKAIADLAAGAGRAAAADMPVASPANATTEATGTRSQAPLFGALLAEALALARRTEEGLPPWTTLGKSGRLWPAGTQKFTRFRGELTARLPYPRFAGNLIPRLESSYSRLSR